MKRWLVASPITDEERARFPELPPILLQLLWNRGLTTREAIEEFLNPDFARDLHDPFLFRDMEKAVERLRLAMASGEKIVIHGDYDADGVCASVILWTTLRALGATVDVFLPHRETDGYGLNERTVDHLAGEGARVIITCDCGISNAREIAAAKQRGIDTIITDHHTIPPDIPDASATLHPLIPGETYPWKGLSGGGVAFKLAQALIRKSQMENHTQPALEPGFEKWLLDLVAISSVADMVPLQGETRTLVRYGLTVLNKTRRVGLQKLFKQAGIVDEAGMRPQRVIDASTIGFQIAPRINAAGRMNHANAAFKLLTAEEPAEAERLARELGENNTARQRETSRILEEVRAEILRSGRESDPALVVAGAGWPPGLMGLVAGKLADQFYRPAFAFAERDGELIGSARSIPELNIVEALRSMPELLVKFGGHPQAAGLTMKSANREEFERRFLRYAGEALRGIELVPSVSIDAEVSLDDITWELYEVLSRLEPFGVQNPEPKYLAREVVVESAEAVGAEGKHLRLRASHGRGPRKLIGFNCGDWCSRLSRGDIIDVVFTVGVSEWNGTRELEMKIVDLRKGVGNRE